MTVAAVSAGVSWWAIGAAAVADAALIAGSSYSAYSSYEQGKAADRNAEALAAANEYQAKLNEERAGVAQLQGEQEAADRSRALAAEIGGLYAGFAGNGLLVDGSGDDTFGKVLTSTVKEAEADISRIRDNTAINVWNYEANKGSLLASAENERISGKNAYKAGKINALGTSLQGAGSLIGSGFSSYGTFSKIAGA